MPSSLHTDHNLRFPDNTIVTASAGSGKTYALTWRCLQLLLSETNPHRSLKNLLAITFTNNAAKEMRERVLNYLKQICLGNEAVLLEAAGNLGTDSDTIQEQSLALLDQIFANYSDFQVKTIDSFMATVFKAASFDFGFYPDFEIVMTNDKLIDQAFALFARDLSEEHARLFDDLIRLITESKSSRSKYLWDPFAAIVREVKELDMLLAAQTSAEVLEDLSAEAGRLREMLSVQGKRLTAIIKESGLPINRTLDTDLNLIRSGDFNGVIAHTLKTRAVHKPASKKQEEAFQRWGDAIAHELDQLNGLLKQYIDIDSRSHFQPYLRAIAMVRATLMNLKRQSGQIFIDDVNKMLVSRLNEEAVPEIYFRLGETIYHFLIDEFQDTSPIQWANLRPLIENSLSVGGSLFVVGDMKQSIYGFRGADWTIMKRMSNVNEFPSAKHQHRKLQTNWRSHEKIVAFVKEVFEEIVPATEYADAAGESGLTHVYQDVKEENRGKGYVEVTLLKEDEQGEEERAKILEIIADCRARGYECRDIALLMATNDKVIEVSSWLNSQGIDFLSYSSLDVRTRKVIGEIIALMKFLDSPVDDLSFATFATGTLFGKLLEMEGFASAKNGIPELVVVSRTGVRNAQPLYKSFQDRFPDVWSRFLDQLYTQVGYLPLYDLISRLFAVLRVFEACPEEEAAFAKLLEVVKEFEQEGTNSIKDFLEFAGDETDQASWEINAPIDMNAVSLMTIHKAKGLERPVVVVLLEESRTGGRGYYIDHGADGIRVLRITKDMAEKVEALDRVYQEARLKERVDELNKLYVALTRAKEELYVIAAEGETPGPPAMFLPHAGYGPLAKPTVPERRAHVQDLYDLYHHPAGKPVKPTGYKAVGLKETRRGEFVHEILAGIEYVDEVFDNVLERAFEAARNTLVTPLPVAETKEAIRNFLLESGVKEYFMHPPGRRVLREQEFCTRSGALFRADRVLVDDDCVTIIDFKTGGEERQDEYLLQLRNYMDIAHEVFQVTNVVGIIGYVDRKKLQFVR